MDPLAQQAVGRFADGYNCAQSTFEVLAGRLGLDSETALKVACGLGGGMGRTQQVCGAVTGGILALGLKYGRGLDDTREATDTTYRKVRELIARFEQAHQSVICRDLLDGCDLLTEAGQRRFREEDMHNRICSRYVATAVAIVTGLLAGS